MTETIDRLTAVLQAKSITIFVRLDQQAEAEKVGLSLHPTQLLLLGNPQARTPLMIAEPTIALDLPSLPVLSAIKPGARYLFGAGMFSWLALESIIMQGLSASAKAV